MVGALRLPVNPSKDTGRDLLEKLSSTEDLPSAYTALIKSYLHNKVSDLKCVLKGRNDYVFDERQILGSKVNDNALMKLYVR